MARCGCSGLACSCVITAGTNVTVSGAGTAASPFVIASSAPDLTFSDTATVDLTRIVDDVTADVNIDPAAGNLITVTAGGLRLDCTDVASCMLGALTVLDTATVDLTLTGSGSQADPWVLSGIANAGVPTTVADTATVDLTAVAGLITADVKLDPSTSSVLTATASGLLADIITDCTLTGEGTALSPLGTSIAHVDQYQNLTVIGSTTEIGSILGNGPYTETAFGPSQVFNVTNPSSCRFMRVRIEVGISHLNVRKDGAGRTEFLLGARLNSVGGGIGIATAFAQDHQLWMNDSSDATTDIIWDTTSKNYIATLFTMPPGGVASMTLRGTIALTATNLDTQIGNFQIFARITGFEV